MKKEEELTSKEKKKKPNAAFVKFRWECFVPSNIWYAL